MINVKDIDTALLYVVSKNYVLTSNLFQSYFIDGKRTCCVIRAAAIAANAHALNDENLMKGAAKFLKVPVQEVWALVDGLDGLSEISFLDPNKLWITSSNMFIQNIITYLHFNNYIKYIPLKHLIFRTLWKDFQLGRKLKTQFEFAEISAYLTKEGIDIVV